ncbi:uncharacterized protein BKA78DRAFT_300970 [Phyllosticta capitalensis]|uniref:uncharacterized protein n=1 Tax=Phyllosticta capitalensis TaxID=121624 RepID=UPI00313266A3
MEKLLVTAVKNATPSLDTKRPSRRLKTEQHALLATSASTSPTALIRAPPKTTRVRPLATAALHVPKI